MITIKMLTSKNSSLILIFLLLITFSGSTFAVATQFFSKNQTWIIPSSQQCDKYGFVSVFRADGSIVSGAGQSEKISVPVPAGSLTAYFVGESHASNPSIEFSRLNYKSICTESDVTKCNDDQVPTEGFNGDGDSLQELGAPARNKNFSLTSEDKNVYIYNYDSGNNNGPSSIVNASLSFKLSADECAKRSGEVLTTDPGETPDDASDEEPGDITDVVDLDSYKQAFAPHILTHDLKLHLNRVFILGNVYATDLQLLTNADTQEAFGDNVDGDENDVFISNNKVYFSMDVSPDTTYKVLEGINEDNDKDGYTIIAGDCNDNDSSVHPASDDINSDCSILITTETETEVDAEIQTE